MADFTVSTDVDNFLRSTDNAAAQSALSIGTTLSSNGSAPFVMIRDSGGDMRGNNAVDLQLQRLTSIEGLSAVASGTRSALLGGLSNAATGSNSIVTGGTDNIAAGDYSAVVGGIGNIAQGNSAEVLGGDHSIAMGTGSSTIGGNVLSAVGNYSAAVGGQGNIVKSGHNRSVILGGNGIESDAQDTAYVPSLNVGSGFKMPTGAADTYVLTSDANGNGTWQAGGGGGGGNVVASYVDTSFVMNKVYESDQIFNITGLSYAMEAGKTYYFKMYHWNDRPSSIFSTSTYCNLSFTPWGATSGVRETCQGMRGDEHSIAPCNSNALAPWDDYATKRNCNLGGYGYHGWSKLEGQFVAPTSATFTPTITIFGSSTGNLTVAFQGAIWQMD